MRIEVETCRKSGFQIAVKGVNRPHLMSEHLFFPRKIKKITVCVDSCDFFPVTNVIIFLVLSGFNALIQKMERGVQIQAGTPLELGDIVENVRQSQMSIPKMSSVSFFHKPIIQI